MAGEDAPSAFALVERAIERGYDLRLLCRELARAMRDLLILSVDPKRASDPDVAADAERERLGAMAGQWSREDLLRAFDLLTKAEQEIRVSDQPRFNLEMALLRLMHLRKLVPLSDLLSGAASVASVPSVPRVPEVPKGSVLKAVPSVPPRPERTGWNAGTPSRTKPLEPLEPLEHLELAPTDGFKDKFLSEIKVRQVDVLQPGGGVRVSNRRGAVGYRLHVSCRIRKTRRASATNRRRGCNRSRRRLPGEPVPVSIAVADAGTPRPPPLANSPASYGETSPALGRRRRRPRTLKAEAMANSTVQAVLEIFPVDKTTIEER